MSVIVQPIKNTVEVIQQGDSPVEVRQVKNVIDVTAPGPQGPTGPQGPQGIPGGNEIGGYPVTMSAISDNDTIIFQSQAWRNTPQSNLTDGGNF